MTRRSAGRVAAPDHRVRGVRLELQNPDLAPQAQFDRGFQDARHQAAPGKFPLPKFGAGKEEPTSFFLVVDLIPNHWKVSKNH
jgi:hypothetical protein